jgi:hypothetical protein
MFELRFFRFLKSCFPSLGRSDHHYFLQAQGYWIKDNWDFFKVTGESRYKNVAIACSDQVVKTQRGDGSWKYPLREWKKYVSTVEGTWASLGLLETFDHTNDAIYLEGALGWYDYLVNRIGFQKYRDSLVINYFDVLRSRKVPNNTTLVLWFFAELYRRKKESRFLKFNDKMIRFLELSQRPNGELNYEIGNEHYLCYNYNAFEFLDLHYCNEVIKDERIVAIMKKMAAFLSTGVTQIGSVKHDCFQTFPENLMFSGVVGAALKIATSNGLGNYSEHIRYAYDFLFENQKPDGSFRFNSKHDFPYFRRPISRGFLVDRRPYPRQLCYLLQQLLMEARTQDSADYVSELK